MNLITARDIATRLKLSPRHVAERLTLKEGFPNPYKIGSARRWDEDEFNNWLARQKTNRAA